VIKYCIECGSALHEVQFKASGFRIQPVCYCMQDTCSRHGLLSFIFSKDKSKKKKNDQKKTTRK